MRYAYRWNCLNSFTVRGSCPCVTPIDGITQPVLLYEGVVHPFIYCSVLYEGANTHRSVSHEVVGWHYIAFLGHLLPF